jgi:putative endonuclease
MAPPDRSTGARRSVRTGIAAEWLAVALLTLKGCRILSRRFGGKGGEIGLTARCGALIVFVEVKARAAIDDASVAMTPDKIRLMTWWINDWRSFNAWAEGHRLRADAVFVGQGRWPRHVVNAVPLDVT